MTPNVNVATYDSGLYARVDDERTDLKLQVEGEIPAELHGVYVQNSPNPRFEPVGAYHWFDGDGMVHGLHLEGGAAHYRNRYVQTESLTADLAAGRSLSPGILMPVDSTRPGGPDKNTANTDLVWFQGKLLALWWLGGEPYSLDPRSLDTLGRETFRGSLSLGISAHPKVDAITNELMFFDYDVYKQPHLSYGVIGPDGQLSNSQVIETPQPSLLHDIAITEHHTLFLDLPMTWDSAKLAQGKRRVRFDPEAPSRYGVVPRHGGEVRWFEGPACYVYHTVNAWEETDAAGDEWIVMQGCRIENPIPRGPHEAEPHIPRLYFLRMHPFLHEWRFNLSTGEMTERQMDDVPTEFPRMNDLRLGRKTRYAYSPRVAREPTLLFDGFIKYDTEGNTSQALGFGPERFGGETVFVPRPGATDEDAGWITSFVTDRREGSSALWVVDAQTMDVAAKVKIPRRVPVGFHAHWVPGAEMSK